MSLAAPERLLAALVSRHPQPLSDSEVERLLGAEFDAASDTLVARGHELRRDARGIGLACAAQHFAPDLFEIARSTRLGTPLEVWESIPSTNDRARAAAERGAVEGALWLAEVQTRGRGRQGRTWHCAPHAGLLFSCLLRPPLGPQRRPTLLSLVFGLGACEALRASLDLDVRTRWPNDLWLGERKVAGLLVEIRHGEPPSVVLGMGVNVSAAALGGAALPQATHLDAAMRREALLAELLAGIERRYLDWRAQRFESLLQAWQDWDVVLGQRVDVETAAGIVTGRATHVTAQGLLGLEMPDGARQEIAAGEVHLR